MKPFRTTLLNKVPQITIFFWIIKVLCTTVGETASDYLSERLNLGLTITSLVMGAALAVVLCWQMAAKKYLPSIYWLAVVLISIFGTLITDYLTDNLGVSLETTTLAFSIALGLTFAIWYAQERTLSIHTIVTRRREAFYWLAILFTFALGTAAGDLAAESFGLGYFISGILFCSLIAAVAIAWRLGLHPVLAFWIAYILTRPVGASLGDYLSQPTALGGLGLGTVITTGVFLGAILLTVIYLSLTRRDLDIAEPEETAAEETHGHAGLAQTIIVVGLLMIVAAAGSTWHRMKVRSAPPIAHSVASPLGDLSSFRQIAEDTLGLVGRADLPAAKLRVTDLESAWDKGEGQLRPMNAEAWRAADKSIDAALKQLRSAHPDPTACAGALESLLAEFHALDKKMPAATTSSI